MKITKKKKINTNCILYYLYRLTYSDASIVGVGVIIMNTQFVSIVVMIVTENIGWTKMYIATRRIGLKGSSAQRPSVALNLKISLPLLITTKVCENENNNIYICIFGRFTVVIIMTTDRMSMI